MKHETHGVIIINYLILYTFHDICIFHRIVVPELFCASSKVKLFVLVLKREVKVLLTILNTLFNVVNIEVK